uniref:mitochondrial inner membrane protein OXA1L-like n=1 Tax=Styela clava TaxID=7725 RepID=UPI00193A5B00|nr:mitochondrial inner membrane protein OXA1L-like [Styela clava]
MKKCHIEYQTFLQKNNINPLKPLIINIPNMIFFSSMFIGLRQMCEAHVPSLVNGGILWFQNLSISDPYMILPVLSCLSMAAIIRSGAAASELGPAGEIKGIRKILMWTPVIGLPFLIYQPSAIFIFWITSMQIEQLISLLLPSVLWGITNPLLKQGSSGIENVHSRNKLNEIFLKLVFIISHWKCFLPFLINQLGSVAYFYALKTIHISIGVPVVNSLTLVITTLTGRLVAGEKYQPKTILGMIFIITGVSLCMLDSIN